MKKKGNCRVVYEKQLRTRKAKCMQDCVCSLKDLNLEAAFNFNH